MALSCTICGGTDFTRCYAVERQPVLSTVLWPTRKQALRAPTGAVDLRACERCGYMRNDAFDPALVCYSADYDNGLHHSPSFRGYAQALAARLVERYALKGRRVVEIGSGDGRFLSLVCSMGAAEGVGYDPSYRGGELAEGVTVLAEAFQPEAVLEADLVTCQHVLEHLPDPRAFVAELARYARERRRERPLAVYFEVPNGAWIVDRAMAWDVIYEHCSYFTPASLRLLFEQAGFRATEVATAFDDQYLWIEAVWSPGGEATLRPDPDAAAAAASFSPRVVRELAKWRAVLANLGSRGGEIALWGAGAKTVTFLNRLDPDRRWIGRVVDLNPNKQGRFVTGTGHAIVAPEELAARPPSGLLVMNGAYEAEVAELCESLGLRRPLTSVTAVPARRRTAA